MREKRGGKRVCERMKEEVRKENGEREISRQ